MRRNLLVKGSGSSRKEVAYVKSTKIVYSSTALRDVQEECNVKSKGKVGKRQKELFMRQSEKGST